VTTFQPGSFIRAVGAADPNYRGKHLQLEFTVALTAT
jgi:hypothetical protein